MSDIERRYRTVLYWYPATWREENADAVLGTLLDEADATGRTRPRRSELTSLAFNGIRARLGQAVGVLPIVKAREVVADAALGLGFVISAVMFVGFEWAPWASQGWREESAGSRVGFGPFASAAVIVFALWIVGFLLAVVGLRRTASVTAALSVVAGFVFAGLAPDPRWGIHPPTDHFAFALVPSSGAVAFLAVLAALSFLAPSVTGKARRRSNAVALAIATAGASVYALVAIGVAARWSLSAPWMFAYPGYKGRLDPGLSLHAMMSFPLVSGFALAVVIVVVALASRRSIGNVIARKARS